MAKLCKCGCGEEIKTQQNYIYGHKKYDTNRLCACGCGEVVKPCRTYKNGHNGRGVHYFGRSTPLKLCECGCNEYVHQIKSRFKQGHKNKTKEAKKLLRTKKHTAETKAKIAESNRRRTVSEETKRKISESLVGNYMGEDSPHWKNEPRNSEYCDSWFDEEYHNDIRGTACDRCGMTRMMSFKLFGRELFPHHIDGNKKNCHPDNFKTLCCSCHMKLHRRLNVNPNKKEH